MYRKRKSRKSVKESHSENISLVNGFQSKDTSREQAELDVFLYMFVV